MWWWPNVPHRSCEEVRPTLLDQERNLEISGTARRFFPVSFRLAAVYVRFLSFVVSAAAVVAVSGCSPTKAPSAAAPLGNSYTTSFPLKENPISEGGRWIDGEAVGIDWGNVSTTPGLAIGHAGPKRFADGTALLNGTWGPTQTAEAVVFSKEVFLYPEVSLRLRSTLSPHSCTGYEISNSLKKDNSAYLIIVRWNGPLADYTYLAQLHGKRYGVTTGDVVKAKIVGNVITAYKNGVQLAQVTDNTYATGSPGFGFNEGKNGDYGITRYTASTIFDFVGDSSGNVKQP
jgi:hypothetical protein